MIEKAEFRPYEYENVPDLIFLPPVSPEKVNEEVPFIVLPSNGLQTGIPNGVVIHQKVFNPLRRAQDHLTIHHPGLVLVLKRGFFPRNFQVKLKEKLGIIGFSVLYPQRAGEAGEIFPNEGGGHHRGTGVDLGIYDSERNKFQLSFLPPLNAFSRRSTIQRYMNDPYRSLCFSALKEAIESAGFRIHPNPIEEKQVHAFLEI
jgi:D-alanyl-D-alanine dipeptidase